MLNHEWDIGGKCLTFGRKYQDLNLCSQKVKNFFHLWGAPWKLKLVAKVHYIYNIFILFEPVWSHHICIFLIHMSTERCKIWKILKIHWKNVKFWLVKRFLLPFLHIWSIGAVILHGVPGYKLWFLIFYWPISENALKIYFLRLNVKFISFS